MRWLSVRALLMASLESTIAVREAPSAGALVWVFGRGAAQAANRKQIANKNFIVARLYKS
jgi:hypothetical protein